MNRKNKRTIAALMIVLTLVFITASMLPGIVSADKQESVDWQSNTKNKEITAPEGIDVKSDWSSDTFISAENKAGDTDGQSKDESPINPTLPILAGIAGILGFTLITGKSKKDLRGILPKGNGVWVSEPDRQSVIDMINKVASTEYYIDDKGFVKEADELEDPAKSKTFSVVLNSLIDGDKTVVIGTDDGWLRYDEETEGTDWIEFEGNNSGVTIGNNLSDQVIVVTGRDADMKDVNGESVYSGGEMALVHEIVHAARGISGLKSESNEDEEASAIKLENIIRNELGYGLRGDGDSSDDVNDDGIPDGNGCYGSYIGQVNEGKRADVYSFYEGTSIEPGEEYLTVLAYNNRAQCVWYEPDQKYPYGVAKVTLGSITKEYTPDKCKVVEGKIVVNANEFMYDFDLGLYEGEAYLRKLVDENNRYLVLTDWDEMNKTCIVSTVDNSTVPMVYKVGENVRIENDRLVVNENEFMYYFDLGLSSGDEYLRKLVEDAGGTIEWDEDKRTATVTINTSIGVIVKEYHVSDHYSTNNFYGYFFGSEYAIPVFMRYGHIAIDTKLFNKDFYGHLNIYSQLKPSKTGDKIYFYYENGKLAYAPYYPISIDSYLPETKSEYVRYTNDDVEEYIRGIMDLSADECYIEDDLNNISVSDIISNYIWNGEHYIIKPELFTDFIK